MNVICERFCRPDCQGDHHVLLIKMAEIDNWQTYEEYKTLLRTYKINGVIERFDAEIPDRRPDFQYPLLHWAAVLGNRMALKLLIKPPFNIDPATLSHDSDTALHRLIATEALQHMKPTKIAAIIKLLNKCLSVTDFNQNTPFHLVGDFLVNCSKSDIVFWKGVFYMMIDIYQNDIDLSLVLNFTNFAGNTVLHMLAKRDALQDIVENAVRLGADMDIPNNASQTPCEIAWKYSPPVYEAFLKLKSNANVDGYSQMSRRSTNQRRGSGDSLSASLLNESIGNTSGRLRQSSRRRGSNDSLAASILNESIGNTSGRLRQNSRRKDSTASYTESLLNEPIENVSGISRQSSRRGSSDSARDVNTYQLQNLQVLVSKLKKDEIPKQPRDEKALSPSEADVDSFHANEELLTLNDEEGEFQTRDLIHNEESTALESDEEDLSTWGSDEEWVPSYSSSDEELETRSDSEEEEELQTRNNREKTILDRLDVKSNTPCENEEIPFRDYENDNESYYSLEEKELDEWPREDLVHEVKKSILRILDILKEEQEEKKGLDSLHLVDERKMIEVRSSSQRPSSDLETDDLILDTTSKAIQHILSIMKTQQDNIIKMDILKRTLQRILCIENSYAHYN